MSKINLRVKRLTRTAELPAYATDGSACFDLKADLGHHQPIVEAGDPVIINTGLAFEVPAGHVMLIFSRSGHGFRHDIRLANCVGVIDSDYRGEVKVKLTCDQADSYMGVGHGDRIAQALVLPLPAVELEEVDELSETARGAGGLGSTGA